MYSFVSSLWERALTSNEVLAAIIPVLASGFYIAWLKLFGATAKIFYSEININFYRIKNGENPEIIVTTKDVWVQNMGQSIAEEVEVVLNYPVTHIQVYPHLPYSTKINPDNRVLLTIDRLNSKEWVNIALLNTPNGVPEVTNVRWKGGQGKRLKMAPQRVWSKPMQGVFLWIFYAGVFGTLYAALRLLQLVLG